MGLGGDFEAGGHGAAEVGWGEAGVGLVCYGGGGGGGAGEGEGGAVREDGAEVRLLDGGDFGDQSIPTNLFGRRAVGGRGLAGRSPRARDGGGAPSLAVVVAVPHRAPDGVEGGHALEQFVAGLAEEFASQFAVLDVPIDQTLDVLGLAALAVGVQHAREHARGPAVGEGLKGLEGAEDVGEDDLVGFE